MDSLIVARFIILTILTMFLDLSRLFFLFSLDNLTDHVHRAFNLIFNLVIWRNIDLSWLSFLNCHYRSLNCFYKSLDSPILSLVFYVHLDINIMNCNLVVNFLECRQLVGNFCIHVLKLPIDILKFFKLLGFYLSLCIGSRFNLFFEFNLLFFSW